VNIPLSKANKRVATILDPGPTARILSTHENIPCHAELKMLCHMQQLEPGKALDVVSTS